MLSVAILQFSIVFLSFLFMSQSIPTGYIPGQTPRISSKNCLGWDLTFECCQAARNSTSVINTGCPKTLLKMGNTALSISSSNYAKRHINVCSGGNLCSPFFSNFSETSFMKVGFDVRISLV